MQLRLPQEKVDIWLTIITIFDSRSLLPQRFRRRPKETAWKQRSLGIETIIVIVTVMLHVLMYVVSIDCFGIELVLCDLYLTWQEAKQESIFKLLFWKQKRTIGSYTNKKLLLSRDSLCSFPAF